MLPTAVALTLYLVGIGHPVLWQDELATVSATHRSIPDLLRLCLRRDAVLGPYYLLVHLWTVPFGSSPSALRVPSALFMAGAVGLTATIGRRLFGARAGLTAGLVLAALGSTTRYGQEARAEAVTVFAVALATLLLLRALEASERGPSRTRWLLYALGVVLVGLSQLTALVLIGAHALVAGSWWWVRRRAGQEAPGRVPLRWTAAVLAALAALSPLLWSGLRQLSQVTWIAPTTLAAVADLPRQLFGSAPVGGTLLVLGAGFAALMSVARGRGRWPVLVAAAVAAAPIVALVLISLLTPLLAGRYLLFSLVGWALLAGAAAVWVGRWGPWVLVLLIAGLSVPAQQEARTDVRLGYPDYRAIAAVLATAEQPGDTIVVPWRAGERYRVALSVYVPADRLPIDVLVVRSAANAAALDSLECPGATCLGTAPRLWVGCVGACPDPLAGLAPTVAARIRSSGYRLDRLWRVRGGGIALLTRPSG